MEVKESPLFSVKHCRRLSESYYCSSLLGLRKGKSLIVFGMFSVIFFIHFKCIQPNFDPLNAHRHVRHAHGDGKKTFINVKTVAVGTSKQSFSKTILRASTNVVESLKSSLFGQCGRRSHRRGCAGWEWVERADLCKSCRVMRGWLTHKGTMQGSALKQNGFRVSYLTIICSFSLQSKKVAPKSGGSLLYFVSSVATQRARGLQGSTTGGPGGLRNHSGFDFLFLALQDALYCGRVEKKRHFLFSTFTHDLFICQCCAQKFF